MIFNIYLGLKGNKKVFSLKQKESLQIINKFGADLHVTAVRPCQSLIYIPLQSEKNSLATQLEFIFCTAEC